MSEKILVLIDTNEMTHFPSRLQVMPLELHSDKEILYNLLDSSYSAVLISKGYVDLYGITYIQHAIDLFKLVTASSIHYIDTSQKDSTDEITSFMLSRGLNNIHKIQWKTLSLEDFQAIVKSNNIIEPLKLNVQLMSEIDLQFLSQNLTNLAEEEVIPYIKHNRGKFIDIVLKYMSLVKNNKELTQNNSELMEKLDFITLAKQETDIKLQTTLMKLDRTTEQFKLLRKDIVKYQDAIENYNKNVVNNCKSEEYQIKLPTTAPTVICFKEYEDVGFFNFFESFVYTFQSIYKVYTKAVVIEQSGKEYLDPYTPEGYMVAQQTTQKELLIRSDKLVRYGNAVNLIQELSTPENKVELIIIYDRSGQEQPIVESQKAIIMYLGTYREKIKTKEFDVNSWISNVEGKWTSIAPLLTQKVLSDREKLVFHAHTSMHPLTNYLKSIVLK